MHALRHLFASALLDAGENIKAIAEWLGHSDPAFTLRIYTFDALPARAAPVGRSTICSAACTAQGRPTMLVDLKRAWSAVVRRPESGVPADSSVAPKVTIGIAKLTRLYEP